MKVRAELGLEGGQGVCLLHVGEGCSQQRELPRQELPSMERQQGGPCDWAGGSVRCDELQEGAGSQDTVGCGASFEALASTLSEMEERYRL